jgi:hypothetical protein
VLERRTLNWNPRYTTVGVVGGRAIARKTHGRREKSWFRVGLDALRTSLHASGERAISAWINRRQSA